MSAINSADGKVGYMEKYVINGGKPLYGEVTVSGADPEFFRRRLRATAPLWEKTL